MTKMMDIIEDYCILRNYGYSRLDGTMKVSERQEEVGKNVLCRIGCLKRGIS